MVHCNLCNKNTRCSCKGGGCPGCNSTNKQVSFINDLLKFGIDKSVVKEKLKEIRTYVDKVSSYTAYEYMAGIIDQEAFDEALTKYIPKKAPVVLRKKSEVEGFVPSPNPERRCVFDSHSPWARCKKCNSIAKYMQGKECPMYVGAEK